MTHNQDECLVCNSFDQFKLHLEMGASVEDSFREVVANLLDEVVTTIADEIGEKAFNEGYHVGSSDSYGDGYIDALQTIATQTANTAERLLEIMEEDECDSESCTCEDELTNEEKMIRRAIWEDEK